jgi:hypothetical protein
VAEFIGQFDQVDHVVTKYNGVQWIDINTAENLLAKTDL